MINLLFAVLFIGAAEGAVVEIDDNSPSVKITDKFEIYLTEKSVKPFESVKREFKKITSKEIKVNYGNHKVWLKISIKNKTSKEVSKIIYFDSTLLGHLNLYDIHKNKVELVDSTGSSIPFDKRSISSTYSAFKLTLGPEEERKLLFERYSHHRLDTHAYILSEKEFQKIEDSKYAVIYLYIGALFSLLIYNIFLFIYLKEIIYLNYSICILSLGMLILNFHGILDQFFIFSDFTLSHYLINFSAFSVLAFTSFSEKYLKLEKYLPSFLLYFKILKISAFITVLFFISPLQGHLGASLGMMIDFIIAFTIFFLILSGLRVYLKGFVMAKFYLLSWGAFFIGAVSLLLFYAGVLPKSLLTTYGLLWGSLTEMLIISVSLAYKLSILNKEKQVAELKALGKGQYERLVRVLLHDISNPLLLILNYGMSLKKNIKSEENMKYIDKVNRATGNIVGIIKSIRSQYSSTLDQGHIEVGPVNVREVLEECQFLFSDKLKEKKLEIIFQIEEGANFVLAHRETLISSVIGNVISNAIKFSHRNSKIEVEVNSIGDEVIIKTTDHGIGISEKMIDHFYSSGQIRHRAGTNEEPGLGYGIMLVTSYMDFFKGSLSVSSRLETEERIGLTTFSLVFQKSKK